MCAASPWLPGYVNRPSDSLQLYHIFEIFAVFHLKVIFETLCRTILRGSFLKILRDQEKTPKNLFTYSVPLRSECRDNEEKFTQRPIFRICDCADQGDGKGKCAGINVLKTKNLFRDFGVALIRSAAQIFQFFISFWTRRREGDEALRISKNGLSIP